MATSSIRYALRGAVAGLLLLLTTHSATAQQSATLIQPADPGFMEELAANFPELTGTEYLARVKPYLVIVRNDGARKMNGYAVVWNETTKQGGNRAFTQRFMNRIFEEPEKHRIMQPSSVRLLSPLFNLSVNEVRNLSASKQLETLFPLSVLPPADTIASMSATLDGILWGDGTFEGPDHARLSAEALCALNADHDEALKVSALLASNPQPQVVIAALDLDIEAAHTPGDVKMLTQSRRRAEMEPLYRRARAQAAYALKRQILNAGIEGLSARVNYVAQLPPGNQYTHMFSWISK